MAAACAAAIYAAAGRETDVGCCLYEKIANSEWKPAYREFMEPVYAALAARKQVEKRAVTGWADVANTALTGGGQLMNTMAHLGPEALLTGAGISALLGSSVGALHWKMNRDVDHDDPKMEVDKARADEYARIAGEIENNLKLKRHVRGITAVA